MTEKEFILSYRQASEETKKQVKQILGIEPEPAKRDFDLDLLLIGFQHIAPVIEYREALKVLMDKNRRDVCIDAFLLGIMEGKREERAKRKKARCR